MSVFGVDFGTLYSTVAITRNGGIDVVINEVSKRETATFVSLTEQERCIGESGLDRSIRNMANTISCIKHFIGMRVTDPELHAEKQFLCCNTTADSEGRVMFESTYRGERLQLYPEQVLAMFLQKLREYVNRECTIDSKYPANVIDCVITVPSFYTAEQRALMYQSCEIVGLNCMSLLNESTSASIDYGIFRGTTLPEKEEEAQTVCIIDIGYGHTTVSTQKFWKGNMKVIGRLCDKSVSCRELDYALYEYFAKEIQTKYNINITENKRARLRVLQSVDKVKQMLSANLCAPLNIENLMDIDININAFTREQFEEIILPVTERYHSLLKAAIKNANIDVEKIHAVEMIGGGCRIPVFKLMTQSVFHRPPSFTLNSSESAARGAAITAAVFSPKFQVREFVVNETPLLPILVGHANPGCHEKPSRSFLPDVNDVVVLLGEKDTYPKVLDVTIKRSDSFTVYAFYDDKAEHAEHICHGSYVLGEWEIGAPHKADCDGIAKIRVRIQPSGLLSVDSAFTHKYTEVTEEVVKDDKKEEVKKNKKERIELTVTPKQRLGHHPETIIKCRKLETDMHKTDVVILDTKHSKNHLESYILDNRTRVDKGGLLADYILQPDRELFLSKANEYETWLYGDGYDDTQEQYDSKLKTLKDLCEPAHQRYKIRDDASFTLHQYTLRIKAIHQSISAKEHTKPEHITEEEFQTAYALCDEAIKFGEKSIADLLQFPKHKDSPFKVSQLDDKVVQVQAAVNLIIQKRPPVKQVPPPAAQDNTEPTEGAAQGESAADDTPMKDGDIPEVKTNEHEVKMDLD